MVAAFRAFGLSSVTMALAGCGGASVQSIEEGSTKRDDGYQLVARTSWLSNDPTLPMDWMMRAAAKTCRLPNDTAREVIPNSGPYGIHGSWFLDFACPAP